MAAVQIVEVGLRDGLQNESQMIPVEQRVELARRLIIAGVQRLELGAFVRTDWVPQMAGSREVIEKVYAMPGLKFRGSALVPNERGLLDALETPIEEVALFAAASESFSKKNINCSIEESFERFAAVMKLAKKRKKKVRGYLSVCFGCPFEGTVPESKVLELAHRLYKLGCFEVSIGDTIGVATPDQVISLFKKLKRRVPVKKLAGHFHDTRGTALANIFAAYQMGIRVFDTSLGGLGGCPYAPGSAGNVATEDVAYMFYGMKVKTGLDISKLVETSRWLSGVMKKPLPSRMSQAGVFQAKGRLI